MNDNEQVEKQAKFVAWLKEKGMYNEWASVTQMEAMSRVWAELEKAPEDMRRGRELLLRVLEMDGDLYQTDLGGAIREYIAETQQSRVNSK